MISVLAYISSLNPQQQSSAQKADSSSYFVISGLGGMYDKHGSNSSEPGPSILLKEFVFNFTPVGGDATDLRLFLYEGNIDTEKTSMEGTKILNGTSHFADILLTYSVPIPREDDGSYSLRMKMTAREADGDVILKFTSGDLIGF